MSYQMKKRESSRFLYASMERSPVGSIHSKMYKVKTTKNRIVYIECYLCIRTEGKSENVFVFASRTLEDA